MTTPAATVSVTPGAARSRANLTVSLIIPTKNRPEELTQTVRSIAALVSHPEELVIIDQSQASAEAAVKDIVSDCRGMRLVYLLEPQLPGLVAARLRSLEVASGDILFFVDDDNTLEADCVARLRERFLARPDIMGICAVDTSGLTIPWWLVWARRAYMLGPWNDIRSLINKRYRGLRDPQPTRLFSGGYMSFRRGVFREFQFEDRLWGHRWCSSIDFSYRVSSKHLLVIDPLVRMFHRNPYGTYEPAQWVRIRVAGAFFFFQRNVRKNPVNWACFLWLLTAIGVRSVSRGMETQQLGRTVGAFIGECRRGLTFLRQPFASPY